MGTMKAPDAWLGSMVERIEKLENDYGIQYQISIDEIERRVAAIEEAQRAAKAARKTE